MNTWTRPGLLKRHCLLFRRCLRVEPVERARAKRGDVHFITFQREPSIVLAGTGKMEILRGNESVSEEKPSVTLIVLTDIQKYRDMPHASPSRGVGLDIKIAWI